MSSAAIAPAPRPRAAQTGSLCHETVHKAHTPPSVTGRPLLAVAAVLMGSVISTLAARLTSFGLADVEGAVHAGFDEGAWITTAFTVGQMMIALVSAWLGMVFGVRRVLMVSCAVFAVSNFLIPFSPDLRSVLALQTVSGLVFRNLHPADDRLRDAQSSASAGGLRRRRLRNESGTVAERVGVDRGMVLRQLVVAMDLLGFRAAGAGHVALRLFRHAAPGRSIASCSGTPIGPAWCMRALGLSLHLRRARPGQSARLVQFRADRRTHARRRAARGRLSGSRADPRKTLDQPALRRERQSAR